MINTIKIIKTQDMLARILEKNTILDNHRGV